jgi:hypothetical protein
MNRDHEKRDELLKDYFDSSEYCGGCRHFSKIPRDLLKLLVELDFADPQEQHNEAPTIGEFLEFEYDGIVFDGYVVAIRRDDYRVSIDGVYIPHTGKLDEKTIELIQGFHHADDFKIDGEEIYAWWD